jgi:hypothetical protein
MSEAQPRFVEGTITWDQASGFRVRVQDDPTRPGAYLVAVWKPSDRYATDGADYHVEQYDDDLMPFFEEAGWQVEWDQPLATLAPA